MCYPFKWLIDGMSGCFLSDWEVNVNVSESATLHSLTIA